jgi:hypothetical protein
MVAYLECAHLHADGAQHKADPYWRRVDVRRAKRADVLADALYADFRRAERGDSAVDISVEQEPVRPP